MARFLDDVACGVVDEVIEPATAQHGPVAHGVRYARVLIDASDTVTVRSPNPFYAANGMQALRNLTSSKPGQLIRHDQQYVVRGTYRSDGTMRTSWTLHEDGSLAHCPEIVIHPNRVTFARTSCSEGPTKHAPRLDGLIPGELLQRWTRPSQIAVRNPRFGHGTDVLDWIEIKAEGATIAARKDGTWTRVAVFDAPSISSIVRTIRAFSDAASLLRGELVRLRAFDLHDGSSTWHRLTRLPSRAVGNPSRYEPLPLYSQSELFLTAATTFFAHHRLRHDVRRLLVGHWLGAGQPVEMRGIQIGSAIEGIARLILRDKFTKKQLGKLRVCGLIGLSARDVDVRFDQEDWAAFDDVRNRFAHGATRFEFKTESGTQAALNRVDRLASLLNRLILGVLDFRGEYTDYGDSYSPKHLADDRFDLASAPHQYTEALEKANIKP